MRSIQAVIVKRYTSAAAAPTVLPGTWKMASHKLGLGDWSRNQDQAALFLIERRDALAMADRAS